MTITKPLKKQYIGFLIAIGVIMVSGGVLVIGEYNKLVEVRHEVRTLREGMLEGELSQADLKNSLYQITDPNTLQEQAQASALVFEKNPDYLEIGGASQVSVVVVN